MRRFRRLTCNTLLHPRAGPAILVAAVCASVFYRGERHCRCAPPNPPPSPRRRSSMRPTPPSALAASARRSSIRARPLPCSRRPGHHAESQRRAAESRRRVAIVPGVAATGALVEFQCAGRIGQHFLAPVQPALFRNALYPHCLPRLARGVAATLGALALLAAGAEALRWPELDRAVIVAASPSAARIAPAANAAIFFELKPGETVREENSYGSFMRVRGGDGQSGWVNAGEIEKIIPAAS